MKLSELKIDSSDNISDLEISNVKGGTSGFCSWVAGQLGEWGISEAAAGPDCKPTTVYSDDGCTAVTTIVCHN